MILSSLMPAGLAGCVAGRWSPVAHDAHLFGWGMVGAYAFAALAAAAVAWRGGAAMAPGERLFWVGLALLLVFLAINKQLNLHELMTAAGRCLAREQGWFAQRREVQAAVVVALLVVSVAGLALLARMLRGALRRTAPALVGLALVTAFAVLRAADLYHMAAALGTDALAPAMLRALELAGPCVLLLAALRALTRRDEAARAPAPRTPRTPAAAMMLDFTGFPKQWVIARTPLPAPVAGKADSFAGLHLAAAEAVPILRLLDAAGAEAGRLIGWVIEGERFHRADGTIRLAPGETPETLFARLGGRFVMLWRGADGGLRLREDSAGGLPAVHVPEAGLVGATVSLLDQLHPLAVDPEIEAIFAFPARRGFLPFGLTPRRGAHRLMPSHVLALDSFTATRVWPDAALCARPALTDAAIRERVAEAAGILRRHMAAILTQGETVIYLSGGHDSRMILAAARGQTGALRAETLGDPGSLDAHLAAQLARHAGIAHRIVPMLPAGEADVTAWLHRSGRMMCDAVSAMGPTAAAIDTGTQPLNGTGADIVKGTTFTAADTAAATIGVERLLAQFDLPDHPAFRHAGQAWIDGLAGCAPVDAAMMLDLARMEQRHGGWGGAAIYGHPVPRPSLQPFSGQRLYEIALAMPARYRLQKRFFRDLMGALWPELLELPINRASGAGRLRFWKVEARNAMPAGVKRRLKRLLEPLR